jgi:outer membrane receptor protein involved in Fe transport
MLRRAPWAVVLITAIASLLVLPVVSLAGTTGKLSGKVRNEKKEPLAGVNIRIEGQRLGAITDENGEYVIIGIPAGPQVVRANLLGYAAYVANGVQIVADFSTTLNVELRTEAVQMNEVRVDAERPLLQKDATSTSRYISSDQLQNMPVRGYKDAAAQQTGIVNFQRNIDREANNGPTLILRGGRPNETAFYVDGFSQQDPLTGNSTTSINNNAIEEVVILNGGFNAEYGRIMSGVVNVITKEGGEKYGGSLEAVTDNLTGYGNKIFNSRVYDYNLYDGAFGGPLAPGRDLGSFYLSGQRRWQQDRAPRSNYDVPLPDNTLGGWTGQGKVALNLNKSMALKLGVLNSNDDWSEYRNSYRFDLAHTPKYEDNNQSYTGLFNHKLSATSFYNLGFTYFQTERKRGDGLFFDDIPAYAANGSPQLRDDIPWFFPGYGGTPGDPLSDSLAASAGKTGALFDDYLRRQSKYVAVRGDMTSQMNRYHQLKAGMQFERHELRFYQNYFPSNFSPGSLDIDAYGFDQQGQTGELDPLDGPRKPFTASGYLQDKYEKSGIVVNAGVRYDYLNVNAKALKSEDTPLGPDNVLTEADLTDAKTYSRISPRLGVGFPVTDRMVMHVNWGQFYQQPNLQDLYVSYRFLDYKVRKGGYYVPFGNPNLKPEMTTAYEVGIAQQVSNVAKFDLSVYYKDVKDLVQVANIASKPYAFASFRNKDFATLKGVDLGFTVRRTHRVLGTFAYSYSTAKGTGSVSNTQRNIAWTASQPPHQTSPLDYDQRHKLSVNMDIAWGNSDGPKVGGITPFANVDVNLLYNVATGTPFTQTIVYDEVNQLNLAAQPTGPLNSRFGPTTQSFDFKVTKGFHLVNTQLSAYIWVLNAFNTNNAITVYTGTGSAYTTGYLNTDAGAAVASKLQGEGIDPEAAYQLALQNQNLFSIPRTIRFGLRAGF